MYRFVFVILLTLTPLQTYANGFSTIVDRDAFVARTLGLTLRRAGVHMRFDNLGQIKGRVWGRPLLGNWEWKGQRLCKRAFHGTIDQGYGCFTVRVDRENMVFVPEKGKGKLMKYSLR